MLKSEALQLLGGSLKSAAKHIGITPQAISGWPDELTPSIRDRVQAALWRESVAKHLGNAEGDEGSRASIHQMAPSPAVEPVAQSESMQ